MPAQLPVHLRARCEHALPALTEADWFSHVTAARLWGIPVPYAYEPGESLHVTRVGARLASRHAGVTGWVTADRDIERDAVGLLPLLGPEAVWCQLAQRGAVRPGQTLAREWLVVAADHLMTGPRIGGGRRGPALADRTALDRALERRSGTRGVRTLRSALDEARSPVDSPYETLLRLRLIAEGVPEPVVQVPVTTAQGILHGDLGWPTARLAVEYQGDLHRTHRDRWRRDLTRVQLMQDAGWHVLQVSRADVDPSVAALARRILRVLHSVL